MFSTCFALLRKDGGFVPPAVGLTTMAGVGIDNWILLVICGAGVALGTGFAGWAMKAGIAFGIPVFLATTTDTFGDLTDSFTPVTKFKKKLCSLKYIIYPSCLCDQWISTDWTESQMLQLHSCILTQYSAEELGIR